MKKFKGFSPGKPNTVPLYSQFFSDILPIVDDLAELKVILFCFRALPQKEGQYPYLLRKDFRNDDKLMQGLSIIDSDVDKLLDAALTKAVKRGVLLQIEISLDNTVTNLYFMNTERGRAGVTQIKAGQWKPDSTNLNIEILPERPNIYTLYEQNISLLSPHIAELLKEAEDEYSVIWVEDAIKLAVEHNVKSWKYIQKILERWKSEGRNSREKPQTGNRRNEESYTPGQFDDFLKS